MWSRSEFTQNGRCDEQKVTSSEPRWGSGSVWQLGAWALGQAAWLRHGLNFLVPQFSL